jgi:hypothetical protein
MRTRYLLSLCLVVTLAAWAPYGGYDEGYYGGYCPYGYCYPYYYYPLPYLFSGYYYCPYGYWYPSYCYPYPYHPYGYRHRNYGHGGWYGRHR